MAQLRAFTFVKKCTGSLAITLDSYNFSSPARDFTLPHGIDKIVVPYNYALGLFVSEGARNQYKIGYFEVEQYDKLKELAAEQGILDETLVPKDGGVFDKVSKAITTNDTKKIKELLESKTPIVISALVAAAADNVKNLTSTNIKLIEDGCGVSLIVEG